MRRGFAGITAGSHGAQAEFEIDYFLLKAPGLPLTEIAREPMTAREPRLTIPTLSEEGWRFKFEGMINDTWILQKPADLRDWVDVRTIEPNAMPVIIETSLPVSTQFYRVKKE